MCIQRGNIISVCHEDGTIFSVPWLWNALWLGFSIAHSKKIPVKQRIAAWGKFMTCRRVYGWYLKMLHVPSGSFADLQETLFAYSFQRSVCDKQWGSGLKVAKCHLLSAICFYFPNCSFTGIGKEKLGKEQFGDCRLVYAKALDNQTFNLADH